jgi:hypothetical protein
METAMRKIFMVTLSILLFSCQQKVKIFADDSMELFPLQMKEKYGFINRSGKIIIDPQYEYASNFSEGFAAIIDETGKYGFINNLGEITFFPGATDLRKYQSGYAAIRFEKWGYIDKELKIAIKPEYIKCGNFSNGLAPVAVRDDVTKKNYYTFIDEKGVPQFSGRFESAQEFNNDLALVVLNNQSGFIDVSGNEVIKCSFYIARSFSDGFAAVAVMENGVVKWGFINKNGDIVIEPKYENVDSFREGYAAVSIKGKYGLIDKTGKFIFPPKFEKLTSPNESMLRYFQNKWGYINMDGKVIHKPFFDEAGEFSNGLARITIYNVINGTNVSKDGYLKIDGSVIWGDEIH